MLNDKYSISTCVNASQLIYVSYTGVVAVTPAEQAVLGGTAADGATPWGNSCKYLNGLKMNRIEALIRCSHPFHF